MSPLGCACGWHATIHSLPSNKTEKKDKTSYKTQKSTKYEAFKLFLDFFLFLFPSRLEKGNDTTKVPKWTQTGDICSLWSVV